MSQRHPWYGFLCRCGNPLRIPECVCRWLSLIHCFYTLYIFCPVVRSTPLVITLILSGRIFRLIKFLLKECVTVIIWCAFLYKNNSNFSKKSNKSEVFHSAHSQQCSNVCDAGAFSHFKKSIICLTYWK